MWIYATSYRDFANRVIFSRNYSKNGVKDYFHAVINADGTLQITSAITDYSRIEFIQPSLIRLMNGCISKYFNKQISIQ